MKVFRQWMLGWAGRWSARRSGANGKADFKVQKERWQNSKAALHGNGWRPSHTNRPVRTGTQIFAEETATKAIGSVTSGSPAHLWAVLL